MNATNLPVGIVYVPCAVSVTGNDISKQTSIVATGNITITGNQLRILGAPNEPSFVTPGNVTLSGTGGNFPNGLTAGNKVTVTANSMSIGCVGASAVVITGNSIAVTGTCRAK
jgi:hypothetical protein